MEEEFEDAEEQSEDNEFEDGRQHYYSQIPISERENDDETDNIYRENYEVEDDKEENGDGIWSQKVLIGGVDFSLGPGENVTAD